MYLHICPNYATKLFALYELCHIRITLRKPWNNDENTLDLEQIMQNKQVVR